VGYAIFLPLKLMTLAFTYQTYITDFGSTPQATGAGGINITIYFTDAEDFFPGLMSYKNWICLGLRGHSFIILILGNGRGFLLAYGERALDGLGGKKGAPMATNFHCNKSKLKK
jgi:hypothetical protein